MNVHFTRFWKYLTSLNRITFGLPFFWPVAIEIRVHFKYQSSSVPGIRDINQNKSRSWRGILHTQASLCKHVISLDRVKNLISGVDHPVKLVCCPLLHAILSPDPITGTHVMSDEHNLLPCISQVRVLLELWFLQWTLNLYLDGPNKSSPKGMWSRHVWRVKNAKNERSFEKIITDFDNF